MPSKTTIASPEGALSFLFSIFALLMWQILITPHYNEATYLSIGLTWLILSLGALMASLINMIRGSEKGNINLLATILLGFFPGLNMLLSLALNSAGFHYKPTIVGLMYVIGSLFCFGATWVRRDKPFYVFMRVFLVSIGLFCVGLGDLTDIQLFLSIGAWNLFLYSLLSIYYGLSILYPYYGKSLPQGKSLLELLKVQSKG